MSSNNPDFPPAFTRRVLAGPLQARAKRCILTLTSTASKLAAQGIKDDLERNISFLECCLTALQGAGLPSNKFFARQTRDQLCRILENDRGFTAALTQSFEAFQEPGYEDNIFRLYLEPIAAHVCGDPLVASANRSDATIELLQRAAQQAWETPLVGETDVRLLKTIKEGHAAAGGQPYSNTVTMVQGSGMGKSRAARELRRYMFAIGIVLRETMAGVGSNSEYPLADTQMRDMMTKAADLSDEMLEDQVYRARYRKMLEVIFDNATAWLQRQQWTKSTQPHAYLQKVQAWDLFLEQNKTEVYEYVSFTVGRWENQLVLKLNKRSIVQLEAGDSCLVSVEASMSRLRAELERTRPTGSGIHTAAAPSVFQHQFKPSEIAKLDPEIERAVGRWTQMGYPLTELDPVNEHQFVFLATFDEAHTLFARGSVGGRTQYDHLLSVFNDLTRSTFAIFLSTSSNIRKFAPPAAMAMSERQARSEYLQPPITELPFDCHPTKVQLRGLSVANVSTIQFMARLGRPLYWTLMRNYDRMTESQKSTLSSEILLLAQAKLTNSDSTDWRSVAREAWIAVLDFRLCLRFEARKAASELLLEILVSSHQRLAYSVPKSREYFFSGYSSEPLIGEAAAQKMRDWTWPATGSKKLSWNDRFKFIDLLATLLMSDNLLDRGECGELAARFLLIRAYDDGMHMSHAGQSRRWLFSSGCPFNTFFRALFSKAMVEPIMQAPADNIPDSLTLEKTFEAALVRFTHFVRLGDRSGLSTKGLTAAFIRCAAYIGCTNQQHVDLIIPVLLDKNKPISPENMSAILIQVKRRAQAGTPADYNFTAEDLKVFEDSDPDSDDHDPQGLRARSYCVLLMELGVKRKRTPTTPSRLVAVAPATRRSGRQQGKRLPHPRFHLRAYGCSSTLYNVLEPEENLALNDIVLAKSTWVTEHPRNELLDYIWRMKPLWLAQYAYDWLDTELEGDFEEPDPTSLEAYVDVGGFTE